MKTISLLLLSIVALSSASALLPDLASLSAETGPCRAAFKRFYYEPKIGKCEKFTYGGCQGNANNFVKYGDCMDMAFKLRNETAEWVQILQLPAETGLCRASFTKFYYDGNQCRQFTYGGCPGNKNRFNTKEECEKQVSEIKSRQVHWISQVSKLPSVEGIIRCRASIPLIFFNAKSGKCEDFFYGGCGATVNLFGPKECDKFSKAVHSPLN